MDPYLEQSMNLLSRGRSRMMVDYDLAQPTTATTVVESGLTMMDPKNFTWKLNNFHFIATDDELVNKQEFHFDVEGNGSISKTKWSFFLQRTLPEDIPMEDLSDEEIKNLKKIEICYCYRYANDERKWNPGNVFYQMHVSVETKCGSNLSASAKSVGTGHNVYSNGRLVETIGKPVNFPKITILSFNANQSHLFLISRCLNIYINLEVYRLAGTIETIASDGHSLRVCRRNARKHYLQLLNSGDGADFIIKAKDGTEIPVHQCILKARSQYFNGMFSNDSMESQTRSVNLTDTSLAEVKYMLHFIYTGEVLPYRVMKASKVNENGSMQVDESRNSSMEEQQEEVSLEDVLHIASKYSLDDLLNHVDEDLYKLCTPGNCVYLLRLCGKYSLLKSKELVKDFIMVQPMVARQIFDDVSLQF